MSGRHTPAELAPNHERIWLQPRCNVDERCWCEDPHPCDECDELPVRYIRADIVDEIAAERDRLRGEVDRLKADAAICVNEMGQTIDALRAELAAARQAYAAAGIEACALAQRADDEVGRLRAENAELVAALEPFVADGHCPTCNNAGDCAADSSERRPDCAWARARVVLVKATENVKEPG